VLPGTVVLYKHTWHGKIEIFHPEVEYAHVRDTMRDPCYICISATTPGSFVFVSEEHTNEFGDALRVPIKPEVDDNIVTSSYYSAAATHGQVIWKRGDE